MGAGYLYISHAVTKYRAVEYALRTKKKPAAKNEKQEIYQQLKAQETDYFNKMPDDSLLKKAFQ